MHLHQKGQGVEGEVDLSGPRPAEQKWQLNPKEQPTGLEDALNPDSGIAPTQDARIATGEFLQWEAEGGADDHGSVAQAQ